MRCSIRGWNTEPRAVRSPKSLGEAEDGILKSRKDDTTHSLAVKSYSKKMILIIAFDLL